MSRIYLIDDHRIVRDGLRSMLEAAGHEVAGETADPTVAVAELSIVKPDLVLLDIGLEERSGFEILAEARQRKLPAHFLVLTVSAQVRHVAEAMRLGAAGYLLKGSPKSELMRAIAAVLSGKHFLDPEVAGTAIHALATPSEADLLTSLSPRERQIVRMVVTGQTSPAIGKQLHLSSKTVDTYRGRLMAKLGVSDVTALVRLAIRTGLIDVDLK